MWTGKGTTLAITVLPPWWATLWFRTLAALCIAGVFFATHRYRMGNVERSAARLELQISERTRELQIARDTAEQASRAKGAFLANMSHELRTPLNAILGFSNLLRSSGTTEAQRNDLEIINRAGEHLLDLVNNVLDLAKIDSGKVELSVATLDLKALICDVTEMMSFRATEKGLSLAVDIPPELPQFVRADPEKLRQVAINLVGNAVKYTERGWVAVRTRVERRRDQRGADTDALLLTLEVEDTGIGIVHEDQSKIFEAFVQAGAAAGRKGTGLGLAITRQFVELMGGSIHVESVAGAGSRFWAEIPVQEAKPSEVPAPERQRRPVIGLAPNQPAYRILIVEDERNNWLVLQRMLENAGFQTCVAEDGARGVELFQTWRPHLIWMDLRMPRMDGLEAARRIRALEGGGEVKIVAVTASSFASERDEGVVGGDGRFCPQALPPERNLRLHGAIPRSQIHPGGRKWEGAGAGAPARRPECAPRRAAARTRRGRHRAQHGKRP